MEAVFLGRVTAYYFHVSTSHLLLSVIESLLKSYLLFPFFCCFYLHFSVKSCGSKVKERKKKNSAYSHHSGQVFMGTLYIDQLMFYSELMGEEL